MGVFAVLQLLPAARLSEEAMLSLFAPVASLSLFLSLSRSPALPLPPSPSPPPPLPSSLIPLVLPYPHPQLPSSDIYRHHAKWPRSEILKLRLCHVQVLELLQNLGFVVLIRCLRRIV